MQPLVRRQSRRMSTLQSSVSLSSRSVVVITDLRSVGPRRHREFQRFCQPCNFSVGLPMDLESQLHKFTRWIVATIKPSWGLLMLPGRHSFFSLVSTKHFSNADRQGILHSIYSTEGL